MLKKENAVEALLASSGRFPEDDLIQRMASKAVVNLSQTAAPDDTKTDPAIPTNEVPVRPVRRGARLATGHAPVHDGGSSRPSGAAARRWW